jgi:osmotically-inducible protein OsmY
MNLNVKLIGISLLVVAGLAACDKPGPAETAGRKIDQTADDAGRKMGEVADKAGQKIAAAADKVSDKVGEQSAKTGVAVDDTEITAKVKAAIFAEPGLRTLQISVDTVKGVVTLTGSVDSAASGDRAKSLAGAVAGVKEVDSKLVPTPAR